MLLQQEWIHVGGWYLETPLNVPMIKLETDCNQQHEVRNIPV